MIYRQNHLIQEFNNYIKKYFKQKRLKDSPLLMDNRGICLALTLCYLNNNYYYLDKINGSRFEELLVLLSDESLLNSFFKEIEDLKVLRQKLMQAESLIERELLEKIEQTLKDRIDILAMIDAILTIHAERSIDDKSFCDMDLHSSLNQNVFQYAGLTYYATIGLALTQADLKYFFTLNHKKCPFERGGQYLLCLPNHAMGLAVDYKGEFVFYDPNLGKPLKDPSPSIIDLLFNYYARENIFLMSIYAIKPLIVQKIGDHDDFLETNQKTDVTQREHHIIETMNKCAVICCKYYEHKNFESLLDMGIAQIMLYNTNCYVRKFFEKKIAETDVFDGDILNKKDSNKMTMLYHALIAAFRINDTKYVEMLLKTNSIDVNDSGNAAHPIELLIFYNEPALASLLLTKEDMIVELGVDALTYLDRRIKFKEYDFINVLLDKLGCSVFFESAAQHLLMTALKYNLDFLAMFLIQKRPVDLNIMEDGMTTLSKAILQRKRAVVAVLLNDPSLNVNIPVYGLTPLEQAFSLRDALLIDMLIKDNRVDLTVSQSGLTPFESLVLNDDLERLSLILAQERFYPELSAFILEHLEVSLSKGDSSTALLLLSNEKILCFLDNQVGFDVSVDLLSRLKAIARLLMPHLLKTGSDEFYQPLIDSIIMLDIKTVRAILTYDGLGLMKKGPDGKSAFDFILDTKNENLINIFLNYPQVQAEGCTDRYVIDFVTTLMSQKDQCSGKLCLTILNKIPLKMMSLIESDVKIDLLNILHVDDKNIFQKQAINILVDRSPEVIELLLIKIMNILIEIQYIHGEEELMRLQTNLSLMLMILKNMHKLHPNLILPPFFEPIFRKMQKEPESSFDKGSSWIRNFIDKNKLIAKNYNSILLQHTLNKESSDTPLKDVPQTLSSYVKAIPMFLLKQVGGL